MHKFTVIKYDKVISGSRSLLLMIRNLGLILLSASFLLSCDKEEELPSDPILEDETTDPIEYTEQDSILPIDLLLTGSSTIAFWKDFNPYLNKLNLINSGLSGTTIKDLITQKEDKIFKYYANYLLFYYGDNDLYSMSIEDYLIKFRTVMKEIRIRRPDTKILVLAIKPSPARKEKHSSYSIANNYYNFYCNKNDHYFYIDPWSHLNDSDLNSLFATDGLHLNEKGYKHLSEAVTAKINSLSINHQ